MLRRWICWLGLVALSGCGPGVVQASVLFTGFKEHALKRLAVRVTENGKEVAGTRQTIDINAAGSCRITLTLTAETQFHLQFFVDDNGNGRWDGPLGTGEHSWDRSPFTLPSPRSNHDIVDVTVTHDTNFAELPGDFTSQ